MFRVPCSECGSVDHPKFRSTKNRSGVKVEYMASFCVKCNLEKRRIYKARNHEKIKRQMKKYMAQWEKENKGKRSDYNAKYRRKIRNSKSVEWHHCVNSDGLVSLTYHQPLEFTF